MSSQGDTGTEQKRQSSAIVPGPTLNVDCSDMVRAMANSLSAARKPKVDSSHRTLKYWDRTLATVTALSLIVGGGWAVFQYFAQSFEHNKAEHDQKEQEYFLQVRKERRELYQPLCSVAAKIATARVLRDAQLSIDKFWELYFGEVHLIRDDDVEKAKEDFSDALQASQDQMDRPPAGELRNLANALAMACQKSIDTPLKRAYGVPD
jgi:hypothetical protein